MAADSPFIHLGTREVCVCFFFLSLSKHNDCTSVFSFHQLVKATELLQLNPVLQVLQGVVLGVF